MTWGGDERRSGTDWRELMKSVEETVGQIQRSPDAGTTAQAVAEQILAGFGDQLGLTGGRVYRRDGDEFELVATFGAAQAIDHPVRVRADYEPIRLLQDRGAVYMTEDDERLDRALERELGAYGFAAIEAADELILAFDVAADAAPEEILYSLGILRHAITEKLRRERLRGLLHEARRIQLSITPRRAPEFGDFDLFGRTDPMEVVGGDFYDFIPLTDKVLGVAIADVSGHGLPAALQVRDIHMGLRMGLARDFKIVRTVERLNTIIHESTLTSRFVSMFYGELEPNGNLIYVNAGHPPPLYFRSDGEVVELTEGGAVLGPLADATYERGFLRLGPGDRVVLYTDGVVEARRPDGRGGWLELGTERLVSTVREAPSTTAQELTERIFDVVKAFRGPGAQRDDVTVVVLQRPAATG